MRRAGFTLAEVLLSVLLLAVGTGVIARDLATGARGIARAAARLRTGRLAESQLTAFETRACPLDGGGLTDTLAEVPAIPVRRRCR